MPKQGSVAILGAGVSGAVCASLLSERCDVTVFEKARGPGGRLSSRRIPSGSSCPLGAVAAGVSAKPLLHKLSYQAISTAPRASYIWSNPNSLSVGCHTISLPFPPQTICQELLCGINCYYETPIVSVFLDNHGWVLHSQTQSFGPYDWLISSLPAPQAVNLMPDQCSFLSLLQQPRFSSCVSLVITHKKDGSTPVIPSDMLSSVIDSIVSYPSHPNDPHLHWTIHATPDWSASYFDLTEQQIIENLLVSCGQRPILDNMESLWTHLHRWRYAHCQRSIEAPCLVDTSLQIAAIGDWCGPHHGISAAIASAQALHEYS